MPLNPVTLEAVPDDCPLDMTELRALRAVAKGYSYPEIAEAVGQKADTIAHKLSRVRKRLGVASVREAAAYGIERGWINAPDVAEAPRISPELRVYLYAAEQMARAQDPAEQAAVQRIMDRAAADAGGLWLALHRRSSRDVLVRIAADVRGKG